MSHNEWIFFIFLFSLFNSITKCTAMCDVIWSFVTLQLLAASVVNSSGGRSFALYTVYQFFFCFFSYFWPHQQRSTLQVIPRTSHLVLFFRPFTQHQQWATPTLNWNKFTPSPIYFLSFLLFPSLFPSFLSFFLQVLQDWIFVVQFPRRTQVLPFATVSVIHWSDVKANRSPSLSAEIWNLRTSTYIPH